MSALHIEMRSGPRVLAIRELVLALALALVPVIGAAAAEADNRSGQAFATPQDAVAALDAAMKSKDSAALGRIFGPAVRELENPDRVQATN
jgi:hypothetical protein